ncbi:MAG: branched-chain amino acid ABC transporter permease [Lachnospiraceae bacterium]|nr:branched-chain amino acid ABC transporter permease [Lachnospiraceae bacterium]
MKKTSKAKNLLKGDFLTYLLVIVVYAVFQFMIANGSLGSLYEGLLVPVCIYVIMALALNLVVGIVGELSLGHAGFMCVGAFSGAIFSKITADMITTDLLRFVLAILVGAVTAAVFGFLIGIPVLRLNGDYLAIVTLAFGEIIKNVMNVIYLGVDEKGLHFSMKDELALNLAEGGKTIVKGPQGIIGTPHNSTFTIGVVLILITLVIVLNLIHSRSGRAIMAIRDNRIAAESIGINITKYKMMAFVISAALAGVAGVLYSHNISSLQAQPQNFGYNMSIMILVYVVLGGIGNMRGSIIAAAILTVLPEMLREFQDYRMLMYAIVLILMMLFNWAPACRRFRERYSLKRIFAKKNTKEAQ